MDLRSRLLERLWSASGEYLSGEGLAAEYGVSRAAIWKHIQVLRAEGCEIDQKAGKGYALTRLPDRLEAPYLRLGLETSWLGSEIVHQEQVESTNNLARERGAAGAPHGLLVVADEQISGKGRAGRSFFSPPGAGLYLSVLARFQILPQECSLLTLAAGVACVRTLRELAGVEAKIKWPNDIYVRGRKLVGILTELTADLEQVQQVVVGVGINLNRPDSMPPELEERAIWLNEATAGPDEAAPGKVRFSRRDCAVLLMKHLEDAFQTVIEPSTRKAMLDEWRTLALWFGEHFRVRVAQREWVGKHAGLADDGALLLTRDTDGETLRILAGDVERVRTVGG